MVVSEVRIITERGLPIINVNLRIELQRTDPAIQAGFLTVMNHL